MNVCLSKMNIFINVYICVFLIWINGSFMEVSCEMNRMDQMKMVKDRIFKNYDKYTAPTNGTNTTLLRTYYYPRQVMGLNEETSLLSMDALLLLAWYDLRLQWNVSDYDGYLKLPAEEIWTPYIMAYNSHSQVVNPFESVPLSISPSGYVMWVPPILTETQCPEMAGTPYFKSEVECAIYLGYWMHDGWQVNLNQSDVRMTIFQNINSRWELIPSKSHAIRQVSYYECCEEPFINLHMFFTLKRRPVPAIEATRAPCILVMILTLSIFWYPPDSSMKLTIGGMLFVVLTLLLAFVGMSLKAPLSVIFAVSFVQTTMYLLVATIILQMVIVIKLSYMTGPTRPPAIVTHFLTGPFCKFACLRTSMIGDTLTLGQLKAEASPVKHFTANDEWSLLAAAIDRVLFVVMSVVMLVVHHL